MYTFHITLYQIPSTISTILSGTTDPLIRTSLMTINHTISYTLKWMLSTDLFNFIEAEVSPENFNVRMAVDVIHSRNQTEALLLQLNLTMGSIREVMQSFHDLRLQYNICVTQLERVSRNHKLLKSDIQSSKVPEWHEHFVVDKHHFR